MASGEGADAICWQQWNEQQHEKDTTSPALPWL